MNARLQNRKANVIALCYYVALFLLVLLVAGCKQSQCPAYGYSEQKALRKQTWHCNQRPKAVARKTEHYNYRQKPNAVVEFFTRR